MSYTNIEILGLCASAGKGVSMATRFTEETEFSARRAVVESSFNHHHQICKTLRVDGTFLCTCTYKVIPGRHCSNPSWINSWSCERWRLRLAASHREAP
jgi:hypothetical protein